MSSSRTSLVLGTWTFAGDSIWGPSDERDAIEVIEVALDAGITLIDTAPNYGAGRCEELVGRAVGSHRDAKIATKLKVDPGESLARLRERATESVRRLKRDRIDLLQLHWPAATPEGTIEAIGHFGALVDEGLVAEIGVCNAGVYDIEDLDRLRDEPGTSHAIVSNQLPYSLLWRVIEDEIASASQRAGIRTIAYSVLAQGLLTGRYRNTESFPDGRRRTRLFSGDHEAARHGEKGHEALINTALAEMYDLAQTCGTTIANLAIGFAASSPHIDAILVGARTRAQLEELIGMVDAELPDGVVSRLMEITQPLKEAVGGNPDMYQSPSRVRYTASDGSIAQ